jgi:hypothetical protein
VGLCLDSKFLASFGVLAVSAFSWSESAVARKF